MYYGKILCSIISINILSLRYSISIYLSATFVVYHVEPYEGTAHFILIENSYNIINVNRIHYIFIKIVQDSIIEDMFAYF